MRSMRSSGIWVLPLLLLLRWAAGANGVVMQKQVDAPVRFGLTRSDRLSLKFFPSSDRNSERSKRARRQPSPLSSSSLLKVPQSGRFSFIHRRRDNRMHTTVSAAYATPRVRTEEAKGVVTASGDPLSSRLWLKSLLAGAITAVIVTIALHPLDTLKILVQQNPGTSWHLILRDMAASKGVVPTVARLYQGAVTSALSVAPSSAVKMAGFEIFRAWGLPEFFFCGQFFASTLRAPLEVLKLRLQAGLESSFWAAAGDVLRTEGVLGLYKGNTCTILRDFPHWAFSLVIYEWLKPRLIARRVHLISSDSEEEGGSTKGKRVFSLRRWRKKRKGGGMVQMSTEIKKEESSKKVLKVPDDEIAARSFLMVVSSLCSLIGGVISTPMDVVKTKVQTGGAPSILQAASELFQNGGTQVFFRGSSQRLLYITVMGGVYFPLYDLSLHFLDILNEKVGLFERVDRMQQQRRMQRHQTGNKKGLVGGGAGKVDQPEKKEVSNSQRSRKREKAGQKRREGEAFISSLKLRKSFNSAVRRRPSTLCLRNSKRRMPELGGGSDDPLSICLRSSKPVGTPAKGGSPCAASAVPLERRYAGTAQTGGEDVEGDEIR